MSEIRALMAGMVHEICVNVGDSISKGQTVIIIESMKMHIPIESEIDGNVTEVLVQQGDFVDAEDLLVVIQ